MATSKSLIKGINDINTIVDALFTEISKNGFEDFGKRESVISFINLLKDYERRCENYLSRFSNNQLTSTSQLHKLLVNGEMLIEKLRQMFTKEKTEYVLGIKDGGVVHIGTVPLETLLTNFSVVRLDTTNKAIRTSVAHSGTRKQILLTSNKFQEKGTLNLNDLNDLGDLNKGWLFEKYIAQKTGSVDWKQDNVPSRMGGDVYTSTGQSYQVKYWGDSGYNYITLKQVKKVVTDVLKALIPLVEEQTTSTVAANKIKNIFIRKANKVVKGSFEDAARKKAIKAVDDFFKGVF